MSKSIRISFTQAEEKIYDEIVRRAKEENSSVSGYVKKILLSCLNLNSSSQLASTATTSSVNWNNTLVTPKVKFGITARVRFDRLDPLSYYVLKKIGKTGPHLAKYKSVIKKYGVPSIYFVPSEDSFQIARVVNDLLKRDSSGFVGDYITNANEIAKEQGIEKLMELNKKLEKVLKKLEKSVEKAPTSPS
ncbi:MAG: hypothetical protein TQ35_0008230 [Candidatus Aramenus sulfurataquae]|jgi:hypothetical protein|uniref:Uncharacterized protein n=2 Tax=Candidatus Aramenus sulfurataquae TaxID=1326980 RepID=A0A0F2LSK9_9CREN|nr:hypothetical protein [Candidatus Aramenus sulfurataquae]